jgi:hypothetical protein
MVPSRTTEECNLADAARPRAKARGAAPAVPLAERPHYRPAGDWTAAPQRTTARAGARRVVMSDQNGQKVRVHDEDVERRPVNIDDLDHHGCAEGLCDRHRCPRRPVGHAPGEREGHVERTGDAGRGDGDPAVDSAAEKRRSHASLTRMEGPLAVGLHGEHPPVRGSAPPWGSTRKPRSGGHQPGPRK